MTADQLAPQALDAAPAGRADAPDRDPEPLRGVRVARLGLGEQALHELALALGQVPQRPRERRSPLRELLVGLIHDHAVDAELLVGELLAPRAAQRAQALAPGRRVHPRAERERVADALEVAEQPQPRLLRDVVGLVRVQAVGAGDAQDAAAEAGDERRPRRLVAATGGGDHPLDRGGVGGAAALRGLAEAVGVEGGDVVAVLMELMEHGALRGRRGTERVGDSAAGRLAPGAGDARAGAGGPAGALLARRAQALV